MKITIILLSILFALPCQAEDDDLLKLNIDLVEARFQMNKSETNRAMLIKAYTDYLAKRCRPRDGAPLSASQSPLRAQCEIYLGKALEIDPQNQTAQCVRDGANSSFCSAAQLTPPPGARQGTVTSQTDMSYVMQLLGKANQDYALNQSEANKNKLIAIYVDLVNRFCPPIPAPSSGPAPTIPRECTIYATQLGTLQPDNLKAQCYLNGFGSEACSGIANQQPETSNAPTRSSNEDSAGFRSF